MSSCPLKRPDLGIPTVGASLNEAIDRLAAAHRIDEARLSSLLKELPVLQDDDPSVYWLTMARINELALLCAGNYADSGEIEAVGDLLVNPRSIFIHVRDRVQPILKKRHGAMTDQFRRLAGPTDVKRWLRTHTRIEIREKPILSELWETMRNGGRIAQGYLRTVRERQDRIVEVVNLVSACRIPPDLDFQAYLIRCAPADRGFIESRLCRFDLTVFWDLRREIDLTAFTGPNQSPYLANPSTRSVPRVGVVGS